MTTTPQTIADFLLARVSEDEAVAREAQSLAETPWRATYGRQVDAARDGYMVTPEDEHSDHGDPPDAVATHIARHDPARVLAECKAKRSIIGLHEPGVDSPCISECYEGDRAGCATLHALVAVYADHPDFDPAWR